MIALSVLLILAALLCFLLGTVGVGAGRFNLIAAGLLFWLLAETLRSGLVHVG